MHRDNIHSREYQEWLRKKSCLDLFLTLFEKEIAFVIIPGWMLYLTVGDGVPFPWFCPRPEAFSESSNYQLHERLMMFILQVILNRLG